MHIDRYGREVHEIKDNTYRLKNTGFSSSRYGNCELCGQHASEVWTLCKNDTTYTFGHEDCLRDRLQSLSFSVATDLQIKQVIILYGQRGHEPDAICDMTGLPLVEVNDIIDGHFGNGMTA